MHVKTLPSQTAVPFIMIVLELPITQSDVEETEESKHQIPEKFWVIMVSLEASATPSLSCRIWL